MCNIKNTCKSVRMANATVHGIVMEVSPIKVSRKNPDVKYFSGKITAQPSIAVLSMCLSRIIFNLSFLCSAV